MMCPSAESAAAVTTNRSPANILRTLAPPPTRGRTAVSSAHWYIVAGTGMGTFSAHSCPAAEAAAAGAGSSIATCWL